MTHGDWGQRLGVGRWGTLIHAKQERQCEEAQRDGPQVIKRLLPLRARLRIAQSVEPYKLQRCDMTHVCVVCYMASVRTSAKSAGGS